MLSKIVAIYCTRYDNKYTICTSTKDYWHKANIYATVYEDGCELRTKVKDHGSIGVMWRAVTSVISHPFFMGMPKFMLILEDGTKDIIDFVDRLKSVSIFNHEVSLCIK